MLKQKQIVIAALLGLALGVPEADAKDEKAAAKAEETASARPSPEADIEARRKESEEKLARAAAEEERRLMAIRAYEEEQAERERQLAREKQERDAGRARAAQESRCQFKPVMSDEDIARCRAAYRD